MRVEARWSRRLPAESRSRLAETTVWVYGYGYQHRGTRPPKKEREAWALWDVQRRAMWRWQWA